MAPTPTTSLRSFTNAPWRGIQRKMKPGLLAALLGLAAITALAAPPTADKLLSDAKTKARTETKVVFVHFGASWCVWCQRLEAWLQRPEAKPVFEKYFIPVKLDVMEKSPDKQLENEGGDKVLKRLGGDKAGIPFMAFMDSDGNLIVNSIRPFGKSASNIGYPGSLAEVDWFLKMIKTAAPAIKAEDLRAIESSLNQVNKGLKL